LIGIRGASKVYAFATHARFQPKTPQLLTNCKGLEFILLTDTIQLDDQAKFVFCFIEMWWIEMFE